LPKKSTPENYNIKNSLSPVEVMMELIIFVVCAMLMTAVAVKVR